MVRKFIAATLLLLCSISTGIAADPSGNLYENVELGLRLTKPDSWHFATAEQKAERLERLDFGSEAYKQQVIAHTEPAVVIAQYAGQHEGINPSLNIMLNSFAGMPEPTAEGVIKLASGIKQAYPDAQLSPATDVVVAGRRSRRIAMDYTVPTTSGDALAVSAVMWVVPDGDFFLAVGGSYPQGDRAALEQIEKTLKTLEWTTAPVAQK
ncbi:hypothetical protein ASD78_08290 [Lysobacter sp. Root667]|uniref:hypothetical protein n=1 Tax=Lysobacter sp. Root667 TaxID=1736581 RepID=UPI0007012924|nr:hypothetical protein [Lysobacter sp. Root667]KRA75947.1 hypothetical protein ASD78_08290 [Lysobacter sp. Root667]